MLARLCCRVGLGVLLAIACGCTRDQSGSDSPGTSPTTVTTTATVATVSTIVSSTASAPPTTTPPATPPAMQPATAATITTAARPTTVVTSVVTSIIASPATTVPSAPAASGTTPYVVPVADAAAAGWTDEHHDYPATDIFVGCGADIVSPVNGVLIEVRRVDAYDSAEDNPAKRGGRSISILGDDGVRYYLAHFDSIGDGWEPGTRVDAGARLGAMGRTGRAGACHLHLAISPPCPGAEWSVRRGVVWPYPYLTAWRDGEQLSPVSEVTAWAAANPGACADAMADPFAADA